MSAAVLVVVIVVIRSATVSTATFVLVASATSCSMRIMLIVITMVVSVALILAHSHLLLVTKSTLSYVAKLAIAISISHTSLVVAHGIELLLSVMHGWVRIRHGSRHSWGNIIGGTRSSSTRFCAGCRRGWSLGTIKTLLREWGLTSRRRTTLLIRGGQAWSSGILLWWLRGENTTSKDWTSRHTDKSTARIVVTVHTGHVVLSVVLLGECRGEGWVRSHTRRSSLRRCGSRG
mmetsp:Transcript_5850/g.14324  ORF Transcript_5850/g.14324 Transcript_5850/m.14324 type:complete len:233 (+) Transcript_5850:2200-2898(+)